MIHHHLGIFVAFFNYLKQIQGANRRSSAVPLEDRNGSNGVCLERCRLELVASAVLAKHSFQAPSTSGRMQPN